MQEKNFNGEKIFLNSKTGMSGILSGDNENARMSMLSCHPPVFIEVWVRARGFLLISIGGIKIFLSPSAYSPQRKASEDLTNDESNRQIRLC